MKKILKKIYTKEYLLFIAIGFLPLLYKICQIAFLSAFENAIKIIGQMALLEIIFKIFKETLINPLFKVLGKNDNNDDNKNYYARKLFCIYAVLCIVFTGIVFAALNPIMSVSKIPAEILQPTRMFLRMMVFANGVNVLVEYLFTFNVISKNSKSVFVYFLISSLATLIIDIVLIPRFTFGLGVKGLGISMLAVAIAQLVYLLFTMPKVSKNESNSFNRKEYGKLVALSFLETAIRNVTYYFVILVLINALNNQDLYFVSNEYIWSIMIVPAIAQNTYVKQNVSLNNKEDLKPYLFNSILICGFIVLMIPVAYLLFRYVFNFDNYNEYFLTLLKLTPCYFIFIFDNVVESYFIATGKMNYVFVQTFITNILVYLTSFILYITKVWHVTLNGIIWIFSLGMILSSAYTLFIYYYKGYNRVEAR